MKCLVSFVVCIVCIIKVYAQPSFGFTYRSLMEGVEVLKVFKNGPAEKAGLKEDDIITEVDGKAVNGADEMAKIVKENKEKVSMMMKVQRAGKTQNIEVKMPRKIKTADL